MSGPSLETWIADGWLFAALRILFLALLYGFLFIVFRSTVRELGLTARQMTTGEGGIADAALLVLDPAESSLVAGSSVALDAVSIVGRGADSTIVVDDPHVSVRHAELRFKHGQWWLRDLGSSNGTVLNGTPVRAVMGVRPGDDIQCGRVRFRIVPLLPVPAEHASA